MSEDARLGTQKHLNSTVGFQREEREKKQKIYEAKLESKRQNQVNLFAKINEDTQKIETHTMNKIYKKAAV